MSIYFLNWQDPENRQWHPVGKLIHTENTYIFAYTNGARVSRNFIPFGNMSDIRSVYVSPNLFPIFANRVMNERRPEFHRYALWSGWSSPQGIDPLVLMARMGGGRATDTLQVYPVPEKTYDGMYRTVFFSHGISHLSSDCQERTLRLNIGERLYPMLDVQNPYDNGAVALRSSDPATMVGYCPRYLAKDIAELTKLSSDSLSISVRRVNHDAPTQFRLLCEAICRWPSHFEPCSDFDHQAIVDFEPSDVLRRVASQSERPPVTARR